MTPEAQQAGRRVMFGLGSVLVAVLATEANRGRAEAQFFPYGMWVTPYPYTPPSVYDIHRAALERLERAATAGSAPEFVMTRPAATFRDESFFKQDRHSRRALEARVARHPPPPIPSRSAPLSSFFDRDGQLVWPADAPIDGELGSKRLGADRALRAVLDEIGRGGTASVETVADARKKLLDYGRPALKRVAGRTTARVADSFHQFLLALYESLGVAMNVPDPLARGS